MPCMREYLFQRICAHISSLSLIHIFARISRRLSFKYEWNFGLSFGWKPYDAQMNPAKMCIRDSNTSAMWSNVTAKK